MPVVVQLEPGSLFAGDFRVLRRLGAGGMGALYVVEQVSTRAQRALKLMQPELVSDVRLRQRFEQEATVGSRIESDHVVKVLGAGIDAATETPWLVMELLDGEDLASYVQRTGPMPQSDVLRVFEQLCHAVGAAHAANIVHRDLKPENVFLARSRIVGVPWIVKVLDFGIAKVASEAKTSDTAAIGSPMWMAPEQGTRGEAVTPQTDVWALGLIAFYLLTGASFWNGARDDTTNLMMLMREIMVDPIPSASQRAQEMGRAGLVVPGFDAWLARAVVRDPKQRFANAQQLLEALAPLLGARSANATAPMQGAPWGLAASSSTPLTAAQSAPIDPTTGVSPGAGIGKSRRWPLALGGFFVVMLGGFFAVRAARPAPPAPTAEGSHAAPVATPEATQMATPEAASVPAPPMPSGTEPSHLAALHATPHPVHSAAKSEAHPPASEATAEPAPPDAFSESPGFDRAAANAALAAARASAASCRRPGDPSGDAKVVITFAPTGRAVDAHLEGPPFAGTPTGRCISSQYRAITVPPFDGQPVVMRRKVPIE
jgi:serine/threonine protein kinase